MAKILYSAVTASGDKTEGFVDAPSAQSARDQLLAQGLREVVLHQETVLAQNAEDLEGLSPSEAQALARFSLRVRRNPTLRTALIETARRSMWWLLADAALVVAAWQMGMFSTVVLGIVVAVAPFALTAWGWRRVDQYQQLLREFAVGDEAAVQRLASRLRASVPPTPQMDFDLDVRQAALAARGGDLNAALKRVSPWQARLADRPGLYETRVSTVHLAAGDTAGFVRLMGEGFERTGSEPARGLDYALAQARFGDAEVASQILARVDVSLLPPMAIAFLHWTRGLLQARAGQAEAASSLGQAVAEFLRLADQPAVWTALALSSADHALALTRCGELERARRQIHSVWPVLSAHAGPGLMQELQAAGLQPDKPSSDRAA